MSDSKHYSNQSQLRRSSFSGSLELPETGGGSLSYVETVQPEVSHQLPRSALPNFVQESRSLFTKQNSPESKYSEYSNNSNPNHDPKLN
ncbi:hypothetical protein K7432_012959 [Basidiobolus ranarum]|uniref:Uncharacterized protein n=1 Tax=Basidiobolus ranarum TaxID=34480 RepID=A0ABR2VRV9_9FUNG